MLKITATVALAVTLVFTIGSIDSLRAATKDDEPRQKAVATSTEHFDLPPGVALHLANSIGQLNVEGWDEPGVEITTIKSSKNELDSQARDRALQELDIVRITGDRHGDELVIQSDYPKYPRLERPFIGMTNFDLEYRVKVPRNTRLIVDHDIGQVFIDGMAGDIHATNHMGDVELHLASGAQGAAQYAIDAKAKIGAVNSDFPGHEHRRHWLGHQFVHDGPPSPHKLYLRIGVGDIVILKIRKPPAPAPLGI